MANHDEDLMLNPDTRRRLDRALDMWAQQNALSPLQLSSIRDNALVVTGSGDAARLAIPDTSPIEPLDKLPALIYANFRALDAKLSRLVPGWPAGLGPGSPRRVGG